MKKMEFKKRILLVGMPDMALICMTKLALEGVNIVVCVPPPKNHGTYKLFCDYADNLDLPVINYDNSLKDDDFIEKLKALDLDLAVVCSYGKLFPPEFLSVTKDGFINVHPSLLPKYRGASPYQHVILNKEKETGVTLHYMDNHFDTGDIVAQQRVEIYNNDTMGTIFNRLNFLGADMLVEMLTDYEKNGKPKGTKQPSGDFVKAPALNAGTPETFINWNQSADDIERFVRALNPFISALAFYRGNALKIHMGYVENYDSGFAPGTIISTDFDLSVATKKGTFHITILQAGSYFIGAAADFIRLSHCKAGELME
ncbi:MAG: methionyl-tRNA formyltransferase [Candidatus Gastranaerophilales bacterium]|nr:methionyl-tRNA formyltransferase [Candidatus Gastranaerophilales bacterium]